jgi:hypothetical protein
VRKTLSSFEKIGFGCLFDQVYFLSIRFTSMNTRSLTRSLKLFIKFMPCNPDDLSIRKCTILKSPVTIQGCVISSFMVRISCRKFISRSSSCGPYTIYRQCQKLFPPSDSGSKSTLSLFLKRKDYLSFSFVLFS